MERMKISEIITDKYKLRIPPTVYYDLLADVQEVEDDQEPKTGHWIKVANGRGGHECDICHRYAPSYQDGDEYLTNYCPSCGAKMQERSKE